MRIALVVPGGVDRSGEYRVIPCLLWFVERLARVHDVDVFALKQERRPSRYPLLGAEIHNVGARWAPLRGVATLLRHQRSSPCDVFHAFWAAPAGVVAAIVGAAIRRPVVLHVTGGDLAAVRDIGYGLCLRPHGRMLLRIASHGASRITVPSEFMRLKAKQLGMHAERLPLGVAADRWPPAEPRARAPEVLPRLLHVASLNAVKDQSTLIRALARLRTGGCRFHCDVVGEDTLGGKIQRLASECAVADQITFHGFLPHARLRPLVENAHVLLVSSRHEADPIVALEAAMAGVPTVGTEVGHLADWAPTAAVAVPVGDDRALAAELEKLVRDDRRRLAIARRAQEKAREEDADWSARRILAIYEEVARGRPSRQAVERGKFGERTPHAEERPGRVRR